MPAKRLTEEGVRKLKPPPPGKQLDYFDQGMPGLVLRVNYGGRKTWRALYYIKNHAKKRTEPRTHPLGQYPHLTLKEARDKARTFLADPQKALAHADAGTFKEVAESFVKRHVEAKGLLSQPEVERCLTKYVYPVWEHRPFRELKRTDVTALLDQIEDRHGARQADMVLAVIRKCMHWYQSRNDDYTSPVVRGMARYQMADHKRSRILSDDELRAAWRASAKAGIFGSIVRVLLLTAQRKQKVAQMQRDHVVEGVWHIATAAREKGTAGTLRLPQVVLDVIAAQPRVVGNPYVFPGGRGVVSFNSFSEAKATFDQLLLGELREIGEQRGDPVLLAYVDRVATLLAAVKAARGRARKKALEAEVRLVWWTVHDLRRTARSLMSRAKVLSEHAERVMGHAIPGVEGIYDQHSYADEKADALARLATLVTSIVNPPPANVVPMTSRRSNARNRRNAR